MSSDGTAAEKQRRFFVVLVRVQVRIEILRSVLLSGQMIAGALIAKRSGPNMGDTYSSSAASAVIQAKCWPPSTAMVMPLTRVAPAR